MYLVIYSIVVSTARITFYVFAMFVARVVIMTFFMHFVQFFHLFLSSQFQALVTKCQGFYRFLNFLYLFSHDSIVDNVPFRLNFLFLSSKADMSSLKFFVDIQMLSILKARLSQFCRLRLFLTKLLFVLSKYFITALNVFHRFSILCTVNNRRIFCFCLLDIALINSVWKSLI